MYNRNFVCGIIPDVMALSAEWRHLFLDIILTAMRNLFLKKINVNIFPKGHMSLAQSTSKGRICP